MSCEKTKIRNLKELSSSEICEKIEIIDKRMKEIRTELGGKSLEETKFEREDEK